MTNVIQIDGFDAVTVKRMVDFLYLGRYDSSEKILTELLSPSSNESATDNPKSTREILGTHMHANAIGDYYNISSLCSFSRSMVDWHFQNAWSAADFVDVSREDLPLTGDKDMQDIFASVAAKHIEELVATKDFMELDTFNLFTSKLTRDCAQRIAILNPLQQVVINLKADLESEKMARRNEIRLREQETTKANNASKSIDLFMSALKTQCCKNPNCRRNIGTTPLRLKRVIRWYALSAVGGVLEYCFPKHQLHRHCLKRGPWVNNDQGSLFSTMTWAQKTWT